jgi:hypothetical protein
MFSLGNIESFGKTKLFPKRADISLIYYMASVCFGNSRNLIGCRRGRIAHGRYANSIALQIRDEKQVLNNQKMSKSK